MLRAGGHLVLPVQVDKVVQMYETMMTRHSTMIVGPTGGGKSTVIGTLVQAQTRLGLPTKLFTLNPKACTVVELYGMFWGALGVRLFLVFWGGEKRGSIGFQSSYSIGL